MISISYAGKTDGFRFLTSVSILNDFPLSPGIQPSLRTQQRDRRHRCHTRGRLKDNEPFAEK